MKCSDIRSFRAASHDARDVVGSCLDHDDLRLKVNHVLTEAHQQLRRNLVGNVPRLM